MSLVFRCDHCSTEIAHEVGGWEARWWESNPNERHDGRQVSVHSCRSAECFIPLLAKTLAKNVKLAGFRLECFFGG